MTSLLADGLLLRPFTDRDAPAFAAAVLESLDTVGRWMPWCQPGYTEQDALAWFAVCRESLKVGSAHEFGIFSADTGKLLGGCGLNQISALHRFCNLGYWVRQSSQRQGIAPRCVRALAAHAFGPLGLFRVEIVAAVGNRPSEAVAVKSGALHECVARNRLFIRGKAEPAHVFSLIPPDSGEHLPRLIDINV